jgi:glucose-1-phosphate thymidylyltransferase
MKGILLAGGSGTRLHPVTQVISKQLLPVYDKPMIYYPLATLLQAGIRDVLVISTPLDLSLYERLLGDGSQIGISLHYCVQPRPEGIAQAFHLGAEFLGGGSACVVLGDNVFYGHDFPGQLTRAAQQTTGATVFGYRVRDPERYGVMEFDDSGSVISIEEKPAHPKSDYAVVGLYFYDEQVTDIALSMRPSARGEYEITDVNQAYLQRGQLRAQRMDGIDWLDTGTHGSLLEASNFIEAIERRRGIKVACLEEIAFRRGYIDAEQVLRLAAPLGKTDYGQYLRHLVERERSFAGTAAAEGESAKDD